MPPLPDSGPILALGMVETLGLVAAIEAADAMLKAADVRIVRQQRTIPGLITHFVTGETAAVRAAVDAGAAAAARVGKVAATHVIARPADEVWTRLLGVSEASLSPVRPSREASAEAPRRRAEAPSPPPETAPSAEAETPSGGVDVPLEERTVRDLRALARETEGLEISGRAVARASKDELVDLLRAAGLS